VTKKVLLIDDDQDSVTYLSAVLSNHGYDAAQAYDGNEGLRKAEEDEPDLIVLDVMMPDKSGLLVCSELKRSERYRHIPILMLTGVRKVLEELENKEDEGSDAIHDTLLRALQKKIRELREEGLVTPDMFLDKPLEPDVFIAKVEQLIGG
jgi:CheY-like chemotaxis protein